MKKTALILRTILLSALLAGSALAAETVDINTADAATLDRVLNGVGPSKAEAIVAHRKQHGAAWDSSTRATRCDEDTRGAPSAAR